MLAAALAAAMARRILGVPVGWPRSIIVGIVVLALRALVLVFQGPDRRRR